MPAVEGLAAAGGAGGGGGVMMLPSHPLYYFSTHNALRGADGDDLHFRVCFEELHGSRSCELDIYPFYDVQMVKRLLIKKLRLPASMQVKDVRLIFRGSELPNWRPMTVFFENPVKRLLWAVRGGSAQASIRPFARSQTFRSKELLRILEEVRLGFRRNVAPKLTMDGTGGTYILFDGRRRPVAVFKPEDEEAFAPCNPRGYEGRLGQQGLRGGVLSGEGAGREFAAYLLDASYGGFAGVPATMMVEACHPAFCSKGQIEVDGDVMMSTYVRSESSPSVSWKVGSFQAFVEAKECVGNFDARLFSVGDVHRIAIFDLRVMNLDRNDSNILVAPIVGYQKEPSAGSSSRSLRASGGVVKQIQSKLLRSVSAVGSCGTQLCVADKAAVVGAETAASAATGVLTPDGKPTKWSNRRFRLIPIDHGMILTDVLDVASLDLVWFDWPQSKEPYSESELRLIYSFDVDKDLERLSRRVALRDNCLRTLRLATKLLQICARHHLTVRETAAIAVRDDFDIPSPLEHLIRRSLEISYLALDSTSLMSTNRLGFGIMDLAELQGDPGTQQQGLRRGSFEAKLKKAFRKKRRDEDNEGTVTETTGEGTRICSRCGGFVGAGIAAASLPSRESVSRADLLSVTPQRVEQSAELEEGSLVRSCTTIEDWADAQSPLEADVGDPCTALKTRGTALASVRTADSSRDSRLPATEKSKELAHSGVTTVDDGLPLATPLSPCRCVERLGRSSSSSMVDSADSSSDSDLSSNSLSSSSNNETHSSWMSSGSDADSSKSLSEPERRPAPPATFGSFQAPGAAGGPHRNRPSAALFRYPSRESRWAGRHKRRTSRNRRRKAEAEAEMKADDAAPTAPAAPRNESGVFGNTHTKGTVRRLNGTARGTGCRPKQQPSATTSTWSLTDSSGRVILLDWRDGRMEKLFFEVYESLLRQHILHNHPQWFTYPYNGEAIERSERRQQTFRREGSASTVAPHSTLPAVQATPPPATTVTHRRLSSEASDDAAVTGHQYAHKDPKTLHPRQNSPRPQDDKSPAVSRQTRFNITPDD
ncbi:glycine hydroxymethyltransferase, putative [Eimeria necatrix]|uniref:Glycine hydroxymethyltransferase, putative n=1 Tax=Eimeria necatrix TaxID=51315 RepID=U6MQX6_9EIME|nr:glycine hydroxymethyltransferase, putative [Eimeria necatrix]CDJ64025.1 glycine hydroxymethyltransferase, putative [Eimeria necatrix]